MSVVQDIDIGGGVVSRRFNIGSRPVFVGTRLTRGEILAIRNRRTLIGGGTISIHPPAVAEPGERHIVHNGGGRYDVIEGRKLNGAPLTKDEAEDLATQPN